VNAPILSARAIPLFEIPVASDPRVSAHARGNGKREFHEIRDVSVCWQGRESVRFKARRPSFGGRLWYDFLRPSLRRKIWLAKPSRQQRSAGIASSGFRRSRASFFLRVAATILPKTIRFPGNCRSETPFEHRPRTFLRHCQTGRFPRIFRDKVGRETGTTNVRRDRITIGRGKLRQIHVPEQCATRRTEIN